MANFFKAYTRKYVEAHKNSEVDTSIIEPKNKGSIHSIEDLSNMQSEDKSIKEEGEDE